MRDTDDEDWRAGVVESVSPSGEVVVRAEGWQNGFTWEQCRRALGGEAESDAAAAGGDGRGAVDGWVERRDPVAETNYWYHTGSGQVSLTAPDEGTAEKEEEEDDHNQREEKENEEEQEENSGASGEVNEVNANAGGDTAPPAPPVPPPRGGEISAASAGGSGAAEGAVSALPPAPPPTPQPDSATASARAAEAPLALGAQVLRAL